MTVEVFFEVLLFFVRVLFLVVGNFFAVVVLLPVAVFFAIAVCLGVAAFLVATGAFLEVLALGVGLAEAAKTGVAARQIIAVTAIATLRNFTV